MSSRHDVTAAAASAVRPIARSTLEPCPPRRFKTSTTLTDSVTIIARPTDNTCMASIHDDRDSGFTLIELLDRHRHPRCAGGGRRLRRGWDHRPRDGERGGRRREDDRGRPRGPHGPVRRLYRRARPRRRRSVARSIRPVRRHAHRRWKRLCAVAFRISGAGHDGTSSPATDGTSTQPRQHRPPDRFRSRTWARTTDSLVGTGSNTLAIIGTGSGTGSLWTMLQATPPSNTQVVWLNTSDVASSADVDAIYASADYVIASVSVRDLDADRFGLRRFVHERHVSRTVLVDLEPGLQPVAGHTRVAAPLRHTASNRAALWGGARRGLAHLIDRRLAASTIWPWLTNTRLAASPSGTNESSAATRSIAPV